MNSPLALNSSIRLLPVSATQKLPPGSVASPWVLSAGRLLSRGVFELGEVGAFGAELLQLGFVEAFRPPRGSRGCLRGRSLGPARASNWPLPVPAAAELADEFAFGVELLDAAGRRRPRGCLWRRARGPCIEVNWPLPVPVAPNWRTNSPLGLNSWTRLWPGRRPRRCLRRRWRCRRGGEVAGAGSFAAELAQVFTAGDLLHPVVAGVSHPDVAFGVDGEALAVRRTGRVGGPDLPNWAR